MAGSVSTRVSIALWVRPTHFCKFCACCDFGISESAEADRELFLKAEIPSLDDVIAREFVDDVIRGASIMSNAFCPCCLRLRSCSMVSSFCVSSWSCSSRAPSWMRGASDAGPFTGLLPRLRPPRLNRDFFLVLLSWRPCSWRCTLSACKEKTSN